MNASPNAAPAALLELPLTGAQAGIWAAEQLTDDGRDYVVAHAIDISGALDVPLLCHAIASVFAQIDTPHARFVQRDGAVLQQLPAPGAASPQPAQTIDLGATADAAAVALQQMREDLQRAPRADSGDCLYRNVVYRLGAQRHVWYQRHHHICVDGYSFGAITRRVAAVYAELLRHQPVSPSPFVGFDRVAQEYRHRSAAALAREQEFWRRQGEAAALPASLSLRESMTAPANSEVLRERCCLDLPSVAGASLLEQAIAGIYAYVQRCSGRTRIVAGMPFMRRLGSLALDAVGPVVNVLPVQLEIDETATLEQLGLRVAAAIAQVRRHQHHSAEQLQRERGLVGSGRGLYSLSINLKVYEQALDFGGSRGEVRVLAAGPVDDLEFGLWQQDAQLVLELSANPARYRADEVQAHAQRLVQFLRQALQAPQQCIADMDLLQATESAQWRHWSQGGAVSCGDGATTVLDLLQQQVDSHGQRTALVAVDGRLSYAEVGAAVHRLARVLRERGVEAGDVVAVALPRTAAAVVALFAVLAAGAVYLPLDPDYPQERLQHIGADAHPRLVIADAATTAALPTSWVQLNLSDESVQQACAAHAPLPLDRRAVLASSPAYLIYTSGSTGLPKGVLATHGGLLNLARSHRQGAFAASLRRGGVVRAAHTTAFAFDASWEQLVWLLLGQELHLCDDATRRDPPALLPFIRRERIAALDLPPALLTPLLDAGLGDGADPPALILTGSEAVSLALWQRLRSMENVEIYNCYGPTECTVDALTARLDAAAEPVIGRPLPGLRAYVLDARLRPLPAGVAGELYLAGEGLALGYHGQPALTASRFVADPFVPAQRMYRSGDRVRWRGDGQLEFLGRIDRQVKVRGFRIELGEVEQALCALPGVGSAIVVAQRSGDSARLLGYCRLASGVELVAAALLQQLAQRVPDYLVPASLQLVSEWPLTPNGKIDAARLPLPVTTALATRAAATRAERLVCAGIAQVLGLAAVGADDDFFALGGDSISAMGLGAQLRRDGYALAPRQVFALRTPARMAAQLQPLRRDTTARSGAGEGASGGLPMLAWLARELGANRRYVQAVVVALPAALPLVALEQGLAALQRAHPALRSRLDGVQLIADAATAAAPLPLDSRALSPQQTLAAAADAAFSELAAAMDPAAGRAFSACHLQRGDEAWLLLAAHHAIVDGVSWRVLLQELQSACVAAAAGATALIPPEETTLQEWAAALAGSVAARRAELPFWRAMQQVALPCALPPLQRCDDTAAAAQHARTLLPAALTQALLLELPQAYQAGIEEILIVAIGRAWAQVWGTSQVGLALESHGRDSDGGSIDLARTVGWLTAEYPLALDFGAVAPGRDGSAAAVRAVKQATRRIPDRGLGFGVLRYLDTEDNGLAAHAHGQPPPLLVNYLGRFGAGQGQWQPLAVGGRFADAFAVDIDPALPMLHALELNLFVDESSAGESAPQPRLAANWSWLPRRLDTPRLQRLQQLFVQELQALQAFARAAPELAADTLVAAEAGVALLDEAQLARLRARHGVLDAVLPALPLQQGLLFHAQLGHGASRYNSTSRLDFSGPLDSARLQRALGAVLKRHGQLAAQFDSEIAGEPVQLLPRPPALPRWPWSECDLAGDDVEADLWQLEQNELAREFSIGRPGCGPLLHALLVRRDGGRSSLFVTAHHLVVDGWSTPILVRELLQAYADDPAALPPPRQPYAEVVRALAARDLGAARQAWAQALHAVKPTVLFPQGGPDDAVQEIEFVLPDALQQALAQRCRDYGLTLNSLMQGAWGALLGYIAGRDDVVFGAPVSGRFSAVAGIAEHIGLFSNTLPVRVRLRPQQPLIEQIVTLQQQQIDLLEHDGLGLAELQRQAGVNTLFDTLLVSENYPDDAALFGRDYRGARLTALRNRGYTHYPLTVLVLPGPPLTLMVEYRKAAGDVPLLLQRLQALLQHLAQDCSLPWHRVDLRMPAEIALIDSVNATARAVPPTTLCELITAQARRSPAAIALQDAEQRLSYAQMQHQLDALQQRLQQAGVQRGDVVAVALPRSVRLSLALGAILQAGAAYLPLDTGYPDERLALMVEDAQPRLILTTTALASRAGQWGRVLLFDALLAEDAAVASGPRPAQPADAAYLLYTSGSTGRPKGVLVSHRAIVNRLLWMQHAYGLKAGDCVLQKTPCSFDVSVWEFFWPLLVGARLLLAPPEAHRDPEQLLQLIESQRVDTLHFVPSMLAAFVAHAATQAGSAARLSSLARVFCSGEALSRELAQAWAALSPAPLHNLYGPTEAAVDVSYKAAADDDAGTRMAASVPIGRPVWNTQLRILDAGLRPLPIGVPGELYLCGVQLADGYRGRPDLTAARFVADPYAVGERMYRTGDVARWLTTGEVEYLGRSDDQLKIRGQRIELGEIETALLAQPGVAQAVAVARTLGAAATPAGADTRQLVGYVIAAEAEAVDGAALRNALARNLPAHMVPVAVLVLDRFPLSANGKLDRKALPQPEAAAGLRRAARPGLESRIASVFAQVLSLTQVQADDDFFALGGHSLLAMRLAAELRRELALPVAVGQIMAAPRVAQLAQLLSAEAGAGAAAGHGEVLHLRAGRERPLFCIHPASGFAWQYAGLARYLPQGLALVGLQSPRPDGAIAASADMDALCERHLQTVRRLQPQGPYRLLGYSLGGTVAQGIAARLRAQGETVEFLGLLDTYPPEGQDWSGPTETEAQAEVAREQAQFLAAGDEDEFQRAEKAQMFGAIVANYQDAVRLLAQARTPVCDAQATLFVATRTLPAGWDPRGSWSGRLDALQVYELDCAHEDILDPASLASLGPLLSRQLEALA